MKIMGIIKQHYKTRRNISFTRWCEVDRCMGETITLADGLFYRQDGDRILGSVYAMTVDDILADDWIPVNIVM